MKIGLIGQFRYACSIEKYYLRALKKLGHRVILDVDSIISGAQKVDLTIVVKWFSWAHSLPHPRVMIFTDLTTRFQDYYNEVEKYFDYIFLVHNEKNLIDNKRIFYLPVAYCPQEHYFIDGLQKDIDCLFIGTCHESRTWLRNIDIITRYGNEWGDTRDVYGAEYRELCSRAKIIINHHFPLDTTNMRDYQAPNFKVLILTDRTPFTPGKDCVLYKDIDDLIEKIDYYLEHEDERKQIAEQGYRTIKEGKFKYSDRMEELLVSLDTIAR